MGCCISIFRPTRHSNIQQSNNNNNINNNNVQDKIVISQNPPKTPKLTPISSKKIIPSPLSPTISTSSVSSFFSTNSNNSISSSSSSSLSSTVPPSSSSILSSKDRSFSNEFLWSCVKENPHIIRINSIKEASQLLLSPKPNSNQTAPPELKHSIISTPPRLNSLTTPHKRVRCSSPNRQKSFRTEEHDYYRVDSSSYLSSRGLKSPSPSRRFSSGDYYYSRKTKVNPAVISSVKKENSTRPLHHHHNVNREKWIQRVNSRRIDEVAVEEAVAKHHDIIDSVLPVEDIDNPLISLDCFIFL